MEKLQKTSFGNALFTLIEIMAEPSGVDVKEELGDNEAYNEVMKLLYEIRDDLLK